MIARVQQLLKIALALRGAQFDPTDLLYHQKSGGPQRLAIGLAIRHGGQAFLQGLRQNTAVDEAPAAGVQRVQNRRTQVRLGRAGQEAVAVGQQQQRRLALQERGNEICHQGRPEDSQGRALSRQVHGAPTLGIRKLGKDELGGHR